MVRNDDSIGERAKKLGEAKKKKLMKLREEKELKEVRAILAATIPVKK